MHFKQNVREGKVRDKVEPKDSPSILLLITEIYRRGDHSNVTLIF